MTRHHRSGLIGLALLLTGGGSLALASPHSFAVVPAQRFRDTASQRQGRLRSDHFELVYDPAKLKEADAQAARGLAEAAWKRCEQLFGASAAPGGRVRLDLTPEFQGATGFARHADPKKPGDTSLIGIRYGELEYLGLEPQYVLTHEVAHLFSGELAGSALGEGIADWGAGGFNGIALQPWWGQVLQREGLWIEPEAFFITGEFPSTPQVDSVIRTAQYVESGLLVSFLAERFGWDRTRALADKLGDARGRLISNADIPAPRRRRGGGDGERRGPDAEAARRAFGETLGVPWEKIRADWESWMQTARPPAEQEQKLALGLKLYGTVRAYEMWLIRQRPAPSAAAREVVREAFVVANRSLRAGDIPETRKGLEVIQLLLEQLRKPQSIT